MPITPLPVPPSRTSNEQTFAEQGDAFLSALPVFADEASVLEENVNTKEASAVSAAETATAASNAAVAAVNAGKWVSGTTYAMGDVAWSPANLLPYRRKTAGAGSADPSADTTNWGPMLSKGTVGLGNCDNTADSEKPVSAPQAAAIAERLPVGFLSHWPAQTPPQGWLVRDGAAISRTAYAALFAVIGTIYGSGDGSTTFNLPDSRGGVDGGYKTGDAYFGTFGAEIGEATHVLSGAEMPPHNHRLKAWSLSVASIPSEVYAPVVPDQGHDNYDVGTGITMEGGGQPHINIQPTRIYLPIIKY